jgi:DNA-binding phage protein
MASAQQLTDIGISRGHAYDILAGRAVPSLATALRIFDATGERFGILKDKSPEFISELRGKEAA